MSGIKEFQNNILINFFDPNRIDQFGSRILSLLVYTQNTSANPTMILFTI
eukprot:m.166327 g.166327  ORF g.166327 m.166327 type:complete len:50 (+) comp18154_c1_seq5:108-257(+)